MTSIEADVKAFVYQFRRALALEITATCLADTDLGLRLRYQVFDKGSGESHTEYFDPSGAAQRDYSDVSVLYERLIKRFANDRAFLGTAGKKLGSSRWRRKELRRVSSVGYHSYTRRRLRTNARKLVMSGRLGRFSQLQEETEHLCGCDQKKVDRGRTASYPTAPAQIPACGFPAPGSS